MKIEEAQRITEQTIVFETRHADYKRCVEIAAKSLMYMTGEGQEDVLMEIRDKETGRQKHIRVKVTKPITPFALNPVKTEYLKMFRVDGISINIDGDDMELINEALSTYQSKASLMNYLERRYVHWNFLDPNGWHITERRNIVEDGKIEKVDVYPLEVTSEQAINYHYDNGVPQWLIVKQKRSEYVTSTDKGGKSETKEEMVSDYYFYGQGIALRYAQYIETPPEDFVGESMLIEGDNENESGHFIFAAYETGTTEFPGYKWGAYEDCGGNGTVRVPPFWDGARFILDDLLETKSIFDVSKHNHVFPRLFHYEETCTFTQGESTCQSGYMDGNHSRICPGCDGTGNNLHFGESDVITFELPKNLEDFSKLPPLANLAYYHQPPLDVTKELYGWINDFREWVYIASFNTTNVDKAMVAKTATEIISLWDAINTRVYPCANWLSRIFEKTVRVTAQYLEKEVTVSHSFPRDMKLEPLDVLLARYKQADGLPYDVRQAILFNILGKTYLDNPSKVEDIKAWEYWKPFKSLTVDTILFILQDRQNGDFDKVLYQNWDKIQNEVQYTLKDVEFSALDHERQYKLITAAVAKVQEGINYLSLEAAPFPDITITD